ncbi:unnamed protein product [Triticum turgidum subsp. durum]|uniref:Homeobox domain-containing protein n=1 Tax=Triticum turgidum subsp. durum TaxID=4567 RepID=A0A9R0RN69_TRITD|nr:unnamed protein product [Triticum turgidum subsp. durum]
MDRENKLQNCCKDVDVDGRYIDLKEILGAMKAPAHFYRLKKLTGSSSPTERFYKACPKSPRIGLSVPAEKENEKVGNGSPSSPTKGKRGRKGSQIIANKKYPLRSAHSSTRVLRSTSKDKSKTPNEPVSPLRSAHSSPRVLRSTPKNKSKTPKKQVNSLRSAHSSARVLSSTLKKKVPNEPVNDSTAAQPAARKRKRGRPSNAASPKNECIKIRQRVRYILNRMNYEQSFIQAYAGEGWKGQSLEKIRPEKELERAKAEILRCKLRIREAFRNMDSLLLEGKLDESLFDSEGEISSEDIFCAICASKHVTLKNDIILCDGGDEGWLCPACDCKLDCIDLLNELQGSTLAMHDSWEKVFPESTSNGLNQIGASDLPSDDSEEDYDPTLAEGDTVDENKSSAEDGDEGSDSDDLDFITSSDESEPSKKKRSESKNKNTVNDLALPSDDSEDDDFDPEGPNSSEDQKTKTNSDESDFTSDSDDFCAEISKSSGKDKVSAPSFSDQTNGVDIMEAELEQDSVLPASNRRQVGHLDYKKLYDEAYGKETTDSSDEEEWSGHSPNGNPEDSDTDSFAGPLKPAKTRRARGGRQNNERTPQSERHSVILVLKVYISCILNYVIGTPFLLQKLKAYFEKEPYPSRPAKESLAQELGLTFHQITRWFSSTRHYSRVSAAKKGKRLENYTAENNDGIAADSIQQREPNGSVLGKPNVDRNGIVSEERMAQKNLDEGEREDTPFRQHISCEQTLDGTPPANKHNTANSRNDTSRNAEDTPLGQDIGCEQTVAAVNQNCTIGSSNVGSPKGAPGGNKRLKNSPRSVGSPRRGSAEKNIPGLEHVDEARRKAILRELRKMKAAGRCRLGVVMELLTAATSCKAENVIRRERQRKQHQQKATTKEVSTKGIVDVEEDVSPPLSPVAPSPSILPLTRKPTFAPPAIDNDPIAEWAFSDVFTQVCDLLQFQRPLLDEIEWPTKVGTTCEELKTGNKRLKKTDGSSSHQSIGLDDEEEEVVGEIGRAIMLMNNPQLIGNKENRVGEERDVTQMGAQEGPYFWINRAREGEVATCSRDGGFDDNVGGRKPPG